MTRPFLILASFILLFSGCHRPAAEKPAAGPMPILFGTKISFGQSGDGDRYKTSGWSKTEEKFTWSEGVSAQLKIPITPTTDKLSLRMKLAALTKPPELPFQPVEVLVNDQKIADWQVGDTAEFTAPIPASASEPGGVLTITFKIPKATSPKTLGQNNDTRVLGICCFDLEIFKG